MTLADLVWRYDKGELTAAHFATLAVHLIDEDNFLIILNSLPEEAMSHVRDFATNYSPGLVISIGGGTDPGPDRVALVRRWLDTRERTEMRDR